MEPTPKIVISADADQELDAMLKETNDGFTSGRVKKAQLASWIITCFRKNQFQKQVEQIRADHFDEVAHLQAIIKQVRAAKKSATKLELKELLSPLGSDKKKRKSTPTPEK